MTKSQKGIPLRCRLAFHKWSRWKKAIQGKFKGEPAWLQCRQCLRCGVWDLNYVAGVCEEPKE